MSSFEELASFFLISWIRFGLIFERREIVAKINVALNYLINKTKMQLQYHIDN